MATYLVIGCAGFVASKVSGFLLTDGHTVGFDSWPRRSLVRAGGM